MIYKVCGFVRRIRLLFILFHFMIFFFSFALFRIVIGMAHWVYATQKTEYSRCVYNKIVGL